MTAESWGAWVRRPEWAYLMAFMQDQHDEAALALVSANANDPAQVARIQSAIRLFRSFLDGEVRDGLMTVLKEKNNG